MGGCNRADRRFRLLEWPGRRICPELPAIWNEISVHGFDELRDQGLGMGILFVTGHIHFPQGGGGGERNTHELGRKTYPIRTMSVAVTQGNQCRRPSSK